MTHAVLTVAFFGIATMAQAACPPLPTGGKLDLEIVQGPFCSFKNAAENDVQGGYSGAEATAIDDGLFAQRLTYSISRCDRVEAMLVVDCAAQKMTAFYGTRQPANEREEVPIVGANRRILTNIVDPHGPLAFDGSQSLNEMRLAAKKYDIAMVDTPAAVQISDLPMNQFDPMCVCGLSGSEGGQ